MRNHKRFIQYVTLFMFMAMAIAGLTRYSFAQSADSAPETITAGPGAMPADLSTSNKTVNRAEAPAGATVTYTINVRNTGDAIISNVSLSDALPTGLTYVPGTLIVNANNALPGAGGFTGNTLAYGEMAIGGAQNGTPGSITFTFQAMISAAATQGSSIVNTAQIGSLSRSATLTVSPPYDLSTSTKTANVSSIVSGGTIHYTIVVRNSGTATVNDVNISDALSSHLSYIAGSLQISSNGAVPGSHDSFANNSFNMSGSIIGPNGSITLSFQAKVANGLSNGTALVNNAGIRVGSGSLLIKTATTTVQNVVKVYLPLISRGIGNVILNTIANDDRNGDYTVSWTQADGATNYILEEANDAAFTNPSVIYQGPNMSYEVKNHASGTVYYRVKATTTGLESGWSNVQSVVIGGQFWVSTNSINMKECLKVNWSFTGIRAIYVRLGHGYEFQPVPGVASADVCPSITTDYAVRVIMSDGREQVFTQKVVVTGTGCSKDPIIYQFEPTTYSVDKNAPFTVSWRVECASGIHLKVGSADYVAVTGNERREYKITADTEFRIRVERPDGSKTHVFGSFVVKAK